jgi:heme exporter protein B
MSTAPIWWVVARRDLTLSQRRRSDGLLPLGFFLAAAGLFPLGVGPEPQTLRDIGAGVVWVCALLASTLSVTQMFALDHQDGSLEQMVMAPGSLVALVLGKTLAHWLISGLPLVLLSPLMALFFGMTGASTLVLGLGLLVGTPTLSLLGGLGAALTLGLRSGAALLLVIVLPLTVPTLIFGASAVSAAQAGQSVQAHFSLLAALLLLSLAGLPWASAAALRLALD